MDPFTPQHPEDSGKQWASLWAAKWVILATAVLVAVAAYDYYDSKPRVYLSHTTLLVGTSQVEDILRDQAPPAADDRSLNNQAALLNSQEFRQAVRKRLERRYRPVLDFSVSASAGTETDLLAIEAQSSSPSGAAVVANAYAHEYIDRRRQSIRGAYQVAIDATQRQADREVGTRERRTLLSRLATLQTLASVADPNAQQIDVANVEPQAVSPRPKRNAVFAFVLALALACGVVYLRSWLDRRIRSLSELEQVFGRLVIAAIPPLRPRHRSSADRGEPVEEMREPLRRLLTTLELDRDREPVRGAGPGGGGTRKVLITSAQEGEGKSLVVCNLALVARDAGLRVGVVDTDLLAPAQSKLLGVNKLPGLSDVLAARVAPHEAWQRVEPALAPVGTGNGDVPLSSAPQQGGEIQVLAGGTPTPNPSAPIGSPAMPSVLSSRDGELDYVFVDAPPPLAVSDALPLLSSVDVIVVVSRLGHTTHVAAQRLNELLERRPQVPVLGIVANGVPEDESEAFGFVLADRYAR